MNKKVKSKLEFGRLSAWRTTREHEYGSYTTFVYGIRSPYTKDSYCRRLRGFFDAINLGKGNTLGERCNIFAHKGRADPNWAFNNIIKPSNTIYLYFELVFIVRCHLY